ncbi:MAG: bifunctional 5,10-methylene-tetrahydrofolate dehydrogenase/5,10-methylene-tetrahydrofolate cyclohydrolase [Lentisphaerae bacterium RIFOXYC12_FULL_60_16]|nr:MAG: bifunctional 5,10-methylene-tetrahydrofolate dehydrogenase/5,10-methylene-tetrahydrofolate cyclohydrolase [Lentisphaerae bacterium RIFOXYC12_FULL_60_16]OGV72981.1 MAG: bifunctional 5,10-methylene-tetrahydrofolate dehydrogenase/5,10-methylene-tetrahydrofolate cyclohydrolase [Lentisphaerae bacterium RIFOXYA12_FULL_60_10]OGV76805.1 MAG: bifunctional 5,10-methylene-tetrahydrofolate dehydrogenase/5,10-methylene-tetrahydrofolate cyclohydrolase [Lentisphaerae bacterium RIFOXYB12_FULL_60_10]
MAAKIIDGKQIAHDLRAEIRKDVDALKARGITPGLGVILVGDNPASKSYVTAKEKACEEIGILSDDNRIPATATQAELLALINRMNRDPRIHGILLQLPLPKHLNESEALLAIDPAKDIDGFHPVNVGRMVIGEKTYFPCTPHGVVKLLARIGAPVSGAHVVVVGRSNIVGKPVAIMLLQKAPDANATVTICHTGTRDMAFHTRQADILIVAAGRPNTITADMVKDQAIVIDVGVNRIEDASRKAGFRLVGDVDFEGVSRKASWITPVPGGVGPMTITMLLHNTVESARLAAG